MEIIKLLVDQLGVTESQAQGGAGAIFNLVKDKVSGDDFNKITEVIPGIDSLLSAAPKGGGGLSGAIGGLTSMLGDSGGNIGKLAALAGSFKNLGLDMDMVAKFVPIIVSFVQSKGGDSLKNIMEEVLN